MHRYVITHQFKRKRTRRNVDAGFTLVELGIVLVVIGLIIGGVIIGKHIIRASQLRNAVGAYTQYKTAYNAFKLKYDCIPGDCNSATRFFGSTDAAGNTIHDGNGDRQILNAFVNEEAGAWQELGDAELIPSHYTGTYGNADATYVVPGVNFPKAATSQGHAFRMVYTSLPYTNYPVNIDSNVLYLGADQNVTSWPVSGCNNGANGCFIPDEVRQLDEKLDDGRPLTGHGFVSWQTSNCISTTDPSTSQYMSGGWYDTYDGCALYLKLD